MKNDNKQPLATRPIMTDELDRLLCDYKAATTNEEQWLAERGIVEYLRGVVFFKGFPPALCEYEYIDEMTILVTPSPSKYRFSTVQEVDSFKKFLEGIGYELNAS